MTTKKADTTPPGTGPKKERGRYAKLLADGFVIEIEPSKKRAAAAKSTGSAPASPRRKPAPPHLRAD